MLGALLQYGSIIAMVGILLNFCSSCMIHGAKTHDLSTVVSWSQQGEHSYKHNSQWYHLLKSVHVRDGTGTWSQGWRRNMREIPCEDQHSSKPLGQIKPSAVCLAFVHGVVHHLPSYENSTAEPLTDLKERPCGISVQLSSQIPTTDDLKRLSVA
jgi:hypothetical protein